MSDTTIAAASAGDPSIDMLLIDFTVLHYMLSPCLKRNDVGKKKPKRYAVLMYVKKCCASLKAVLGKPPRLSDLNEANCNAMVEHLKTVRKLQDSTTRKACDMLFAVWRLAGDMGLVLVPWQLRRKTGRVPTCHPSDPQEKFPLVDSPQTLWGICVHNFFPKNLDIKSEKTKCDYQHAMRCFAKFLGRQPVLSDLNDDKVTEWTKAMRESDLSIYTVREKMGRILTLWTWAAKRRLVEQFPTIRRPSGPDPEPFAWTEEQLIRLFNSAGDERGLIAGVRAGHWWQAWLAFIYCTGERKGAGLALRWEWVNLETGVVAIPANVRKGGKKRGVYNLWPEVIALLHRISRPEREKVFEWPRTYGSYYYQFTRILKAAGLPTGRKCKTHALRATHATMKTIMGLDASRSLLHSDAATTRKHYIDVRHLPADNAKLPIVWQPDGPTVALPQPPKLGWRGDEQPTMPPDFEAPELWL